MGSVYFSLGKAVSLNINTVTQPINLYGDCVRVDVHVNPQIWLLAGSLPRNLTILSMAVNVDIHVPIKAFQNRPIRNDLLGTRAKVGQLP